jgi:hypothetical protein
MSRPDLSTLRVDAELARQIDAIVESSVKKPVLMGDASVLALLAGANRPIDIGKEYSISCGIERVSWKPVSITPNIRINIDTLERVCACGQPSMPDSELCADCRTIAEECRTVTRSEPESPNRPHEPLRDWINKPCGTICEGRRR